MTAKEGLARLRAVRATLGEPGEWPPQWPIGTGCIAQKAAGVNSGYRLKLRLKICSFDAITTAYDSRDPVALDAALDELEREIAANE